MITFHRKPLAAMAAGIVLAVIAFVLVVPDRGSRRTDYDAPNGARPTPGGIGVAAGEKMAGAAASEPWDVGIQEAVAALAGDWRPEVEGVEGVAADLAGRTIIRFESEPSGHLRRIISMGTHRGPPELLRIDEDSRLPVLVVTDARGEKTRIVATDPGTVRLERTGEGAPLVLKRIAL